MPEYKRPGEMLKVEGPVWLVPGEGGGRFPRSNAVLIRDGSACALIDTGCGIEVLRELRQKLRVDLVINTHSHPDHAAGNFLFSGVEILVPEPAAETAGRLQALSERFFDDPPLRPTWQAFVKERMGFQDQAPSGTYAVEGEIALGRTRLQVIHTPGHSADHVCLFSPEQRLLISADIDLTRFGPWYGHPESDLDQLRASIALVRALKPAVVVSAHRPPVRRDVDRALSSFADVIEQRSQRLRGYLEKEHTLDEIVDAALVYGRFPYALSIMRYWEKQMIGKHIAELVGSGQIEQTGGGYRARGRGASPVA